MHLNMIDCTYLHRVFMNQLGIWFGPTTHKHKEMDNKQKYVLTYCTKKVIKLHIG